MTSRIPEYRIRTTLSSKGKKIKKDKEIKCYLCGEDAIQYLSPDFTLDKVIACEKCGMYRLTFSAFRYNFDEEIGLYYRHEDIGEKIPYCQEQKDRLSKFVRKTYEPEKPELPQIDPNRIKSETGK